MQSILPREPESLGFAEVGENVLVNRTVQFYNPRKVALKNHIIIDDYSVISADELVSVGSNVHIHSHVCL